ncbi:hypothetical protein [Pseudomonas palleroniana]|uniref:hypothetical protein n=1 Tax=Pseudomonas palleroniana TaxID=191390 RepID=UPI0018E66D5B|nr:hypothetical protein [Pseudomonas palleroniana]MBI6910966.1 hypothetical protein [Pseudomonas palleroniana]
MTILLKDWCAFCEGISYFDKSHFLALLKVHSSPTEIAKALSYFPYAEGLVFRINEVIQAGTLEDDFYLRPTIKSRKLELMRKGRAWLQDQANFCKDLGDHELYEICHRAKLVYEKKDQFKSFDNLDFPGNWVLELLGDHVRDCRLLKTEQEYALFEALYGVAADYYLAWYMGQPLINLRFDFRSYFEFWKVGGAGYLFEDKFVICRR